MDIIKISLQFTKLMEHCLRGLSDEEGTNLTLAEIIIHFITTWTCQTHVTWTGDRKEIITLLQS